MDYDPPDLSRWFWIVAGDETRFWSSADGSYVETVPAGAGVTRIASESELDEVLSAYGLLGPTSRRKVLKSVVQARLIDAGLMDAAKLALDSNSAFFARWFAPDRPEVYADDPDALMLLAAIGANPETIMAPE